MQLGNDADHIVDASDIDVFTTTSLSIASRLSTILHTREDAAMEGAPLHPYLVQLDEQIRKSQRVATLYAKKLEDLDRNERDQNDLSHQPDGEHLDDDVVTPVTETVREVANVR